MVKDGNSVLYTSTTMSYVPWWLKKNVSVEPISENLPSDIEIQKADYEKSNDKDERLVEAMHLPSTSKSYLSSHSKIQKQLTKNDKQPLIYSGSLLLASNAKHPSENFAHEAEHGLSYRQPIEREIPLRNATAFDINNNSVYLAPITSYTSGTYQKSTNLFANPSSSRIHFKARDTAQKQSQDENFESSFDSIDSLQSISLISFDKHCLHNAVSSKQKESERLRKVTSLTINNNSICLPSKSHSESGTPSADHDFNRQQQISTSSTIDDDTLSPQTNAYDCRNNSFIENCEVIKTFVDTVLSQKDYYKKKIEEELELDEVLLVAMESTMIENDNLRIKG